ncbi:MAG: hypothetical protein IPM16_13865 [Chloroflexi bacterium]|nr:hypothetical protein [Chloroflexota bacterium]
MTFPAIDDRFEAVYEFLASGPSAAEILAYRPTAELQQRLDDLLARNAAGALTEAERDELDEFLRFDRFISSLKRHARARIDVP